NPTPSFAGSSGSSAGITMMWKWLTRWAADTWGSRPIDRDTKASGTSRGDDASYPFRRKPSGGRRAALSTAPWRSGDAGLVLGQRGLPENAELAVRLQQRELHVLEVAVRLTQRLVQVVLGYVLRLEAIGEDPAVAAHDHRLALDQTPEAQAGDAEPIGQRIDREQGAYDDDAAQERAFAAGQGVGYALAHEHDHQQVEGRELADGPLAGEADHRQHEDVDEQGPGDQFPPGHLELEHRTAASGACRQLLEQLRLARLQLVAH